MNKVLSQREFYDKVYAGWIGKNIGGTLGGPLEGIMELLDVKFYTQSFVKPVENDDLDLQLVALHAIEEYGGTFNTALWAREWLSHVRFQADEYGHSLTNMRRGVGAPLSGSYNNFFTDCMGSPIRSELWGMVCRGNPDLAAYFACQDAMLDHAGGEGVYGEIFFAVFESLAFTCDDIVLLINTSLKYLPEGSAVRGAVAYLLDCHGKGMDWKENRACLIEKYGTENFTHAPLNIAFTLMGLLYGTGFTERLLISTNCGYDTDCTCATVASMMGILYGTGYIDKIWTEPLGENIVVSPPVNGFPAPRNIKELTERTIRAKALVDAQYNASGRDAYQLDFRADIERHTLPAQAVRGYDLLCEVSYGEGHPAVEVNGRKTVSVSITNKKTKACEMLLAAGADDSLAIESREQTAYLEPNETMKLDFTVRASKKSAVYRGRINITYLTGGLRWSADCIPFTLVPTQDWRIRSEAGTADLAGLTSRIDVPPAFWGAGFTAESKLHVEYDSNIKFIVSCAAPVKLELDGHILFDCPEYTPVIPAYHRSDARKCANREIKAGDYTVTVRVGAYPEAGDVFFYTVDPDADFANINECTLSIN
jgi:ADP-ribosylglycohydrolase